MKATLAGTTLLAAASIARRRVWSEVALHDLLGAKGGPTSVARAVDIHGIVVGTASGRGFRHDGRSLRWLTSLGTASEAVAIDHRGVIAGSRWSGDDSARPVCWAPDGASVELSTPVGHGGGATAIGAGLVVGWSVRHGGLEAPRAWLWRSSTDGAPLSDGSEGRDRAEAIGGSGDVVGSIESDEGVQRATLWRSPGTTSATRQTLPTLGGEAGSAQSIANGPDGLMVVGWTSDSADRQLGCIWRSDRTGGAVPPPVSLPGLGGSRSAALAVNNGGTIAGWSNDGDGKPRACVWKPPYRTAIDLGTLGGDTSTAFAINDHGVVVGTASTGTGAIGLPLRPGGWSWEDHAFRHPAG